MARKGKVRLWQVQARSKKNDSVLFTTARYYVPAERREKIDWLFFLSRASEFITYTGKAYQRAPNFH